MPRSARLSCGAGGVSRGRCVRLEFASRHAPSPLKAVRGEAVRLADLHKNKCSQTNNITMKNRFFVLTAGVSLVLAGCFVPSVNPLYTEKDLVYDPALLGTWGEPKDEERYIFTRAGEKAYTWTVKEKDGSSEFDAHLLQLGEHRFLDALLVRMKGEWKGGGFGRVAYVARPAHIFFKVEVTNATLRLGGLHPEWLGKLLKEQPGLIAHEWVKEPDANDESRVLLTASTADLQKFMLKYVGNTNVFVTPDPLPKLEAAAVKP